MARLFTRSSSQRGTYAGSVVSGRPLTLAGWFYTTDGSGTGTIISLSAAAAALDCYLLDISGGKARAIDAAGGTTAVCISAGSYPTSQWVHVAAVFRTTTDRSVWLNGVETTNGDTAGTPTLDITTVGALAQASVFSNHMEGHLAEIGIWSVALSAREIQASARRYAPPLIRPQSLAAYWPISGNDSPELDRWRNRYDLTLTNAPTKADHPPMIYAY